METTITEDETISRIDVRPPYYALRDVKRVEGGGVRAMVSATQNMGMEIGPIAASDAARHMAITASVSAGLGNPAEGRHMYLAYDAEFRRARQRPPEDATEFEVSASHSYIDPGTVQAFTVLRTADGTPVNSLSVYFMVLPYDDFFGFFAEHQQPSAVVSDDPYRDVIGLQDVKVGDNRLTASFGEIDPSRCVGHFDGLPAMPVAYLMANVVTAAGRLLKNVLNADTLQFSVREGSVRAEALAFAGERVEIEVDYQQFSGGTYWFHAKAMVGDEKSVGALHCKLRVRDQETLG